MPRFCRSEIFLCSKLLVLLYLVFQFLWTVPFLMCSTVETIFSKTTCYWGETFPLGPLTLHEMGGVQGILHFLPLFPFWVALPALSTVGITV